MDSDANTNVLFVPYRPGRSSSSSSGEVSQQKHAAREYHRKAKERRRVAKQVAANEEAIFEVNRLMDIPHHRPILPRSKSAMSVDLPLARSVAGDRIDPFNTLGDKHMSPHANEMFKYSLVYQWPLFGFANPGATVDDMKRQVMSRIVSSATSYYCVVFTGATHWAMQYGREVSQENAMLRLHYKNRALNKMAQEINEWGSKVPNETLYTMLSLAAYGRSGEKLKPPPYKPNQSILATAHDLDFFSRLPVEWAHLRVMFALLRERGGLVSMARPGFALITSIYDILTSLQRLEVPAFPLIKTTDELLKSWPTPSDGTSPLSFSLGKNFKNLPDSEDFSQLHHTLNNIISTVIGYDRYQRNTRDAPILHQVLHVRSTLIHELLSLPRSIDDHVTVESAVYQICLFGAMSFMLVALYPIARENGPHTSLAGQLQALLEQASALGMWDTHSPLLIWASMLGGIMAKDTVTRLWFIEHLNQSGIKHTLLAWPSVSTILTSFLWLGRECDQEGKEMWDETWHVTASRAASV